MEMGLAKKKDTDVLTALPAPTPWPGANARLLGVGAGLPVNEVDRLALFSADEFERFTVEWANGYLSKKKDVHEVQWRGGSGDKGRDVVVWLDPPNKNPRKWELYQCKRYDANLGLSKAGVEIAKLLYYTFNGEYTTPESYWFVTHKGVTSPFQDLLDDPVKLMTEMISTWDNYADSISSSKTINLTADFKKYIEKFQFSIIGAKQPEQLIKEHAQTQYHMVVFGAPLIYRPEIPTPPSVVAEAEARYIEQIYNVISKHLKTKVSSAHDFKNSNYHTGLFTRSRLTFYSAEGLFELSRDQFASTELFDSLLGEFGDGLFYCYTEPNDEPMVRLKKTVLAAQSLQLNAHPLSPHMNSKDREGMCHQLANKNVLDWCAYD